MGGKEKFESEVKPSPAGVFIEQTNKHTHTPSQTDCDVEKIKARIKSKAETTQEPTK